MKTNGFFQKVKTFSYGYLLFFLFDIAVAAAFFSFSADSLDYLAIAIGVTVILFSAVFAVLTLSREKRGATFFFRILFAVVALLAGVAALIGRESAVASIVAAFGLILIVDASFKLNSTVLAKRFRSSLWWVLLVIALLLIAGGFSLIRFRIEDRTWLAYLLGALLVLDGIANLLTPFYLSMWKTVSAKEEQALSEKSAEADEKREN